MTSRDRLLEAIVDHLAEHGIGDTSLRRLAESVGTSHRMLIYHFGSRDGLLAEVVRWIEADQRALMTRTFDQLPIAFSPAEVAAANSLFWDAIVLATSRFGGLFFELAGHAIQQRPHAAGLRADLIDGWLPGMVELLVRLGVPRDQAPAAGRLALGASRGLLLDLLISGDRTGVDQAAALLNDLLSSLVPPPAPGM